jgi:hypothetical protein
VESQSGVEDTGANSDENCTETTAVVPIQTTIGIKYSDNLYSSCMLRRWSGEVGVAWRFVESVGYRRSRGQLLIKVSDISATIGASDVSDTTHRL